MAMFGVDVSHWNYDALKNDTGIWRYIKGSADFVICKLTEGISFVDDKALELQDFFITKNIGYYHYLRPEIVNNAAKEAEHFVNQLALVGAIGKAVLAVDVEVDAFRHTTFDSYTRRFCDCVYNATKVRPLLYTSESMLPFFGNTCAGNYGLWVAKWNSEHAPKTAPWGFYAIHQFDVYRTAGGSLDLDVFNGDETAWKKYAAQNE